MQLANLPLLRAPHKDRGADTVYPFLVHGPTSAAYDIVEGVRAAAGLKSAVILESTKDQLHRCYFQPLF